MEQFKSINSRSKASDIPHSGTRGQDTQYCVFRS